VALTGLVERPADAEVRALAEEILAKHPYAQWRHVDLESLDRFSNWIKDYFGWMGRLYFESPVLYWLLIVGLLAVAVGLMVHIVWTIRVASRLRAPGPVRIDPEKPPRWAAEAEALAHQGRYLEATHRLVLGSSELLVRGGWIELARAEPNRVLRRRLREASLPDTTRTRFLALLDAFETRFFRDRVEDPALYQDWKGLHSTLARQVGGSA